MAHGLRLHHPTERNCTYLVKHPRKTYHLRLDNEGNVIVSQTVFDYLSEVNLGGLIFLNTVSAPPTITVGLNGAQVKARVVRWKKDG